MSNTFSWKTKFKSIIIVDGELFSNEYNLKVSLTPHTADLKEQTDYFERLKNLFEMVFANTITTWRDEPLYHVLKKSSSNRFIELSSWQGDGITYTVDKDSKELILLDAPDWFSDKYTKFDPWWLRADTATYDEEFDKGIYTGHFSWNNNQIPVDKKHEEHAKIFEFNPKVLDGGKDKNK